jgi:hypothetical protein
MNSNYSDLLNLDEVANMLKQKESLEDEKHLNSMIMEEPFHMESSLYNQDTSI